MNIKKLLSKQTYKRLEKRLTACRTSTPRGERTQYELLREMLAEHFTLRRVLLFPDKVLVNLAETIQDFHIEQSNLDSYLHHTKNYLEYQTEQYKKEREKLTHKVNWEKGRKGVSYLNSYEQLDLFHLAKSYQEGYHKQQALMYHLLLEIIQKIQREDI